MKVIDQTPFFKNGEISLVDRGKAIMKFGNKWQAEVEAQQSVVAILARVLDKNYTLLCNVTPSDLGTTIPLILIGPPGVFVMYVTSLTGSYRAKGDQWGTVSGNTFKPDKLNLLTRTERMARAVQMYLQRQGYSNLTTVEAILVCANTSLYVDSLRPIIRIVMRDALERLAISITQARVILSPETAYEIVNRILNPPKASAPGTERATPEAPGMLANAEPSAEEPYVPDFALPEAQPENASGMQAGYNFDEKAASNETGKGSGEALPALLGRSSQATSPAPLAQTRPQVRRRRGLSRKQWAFILIMFIIWVLIMAAFVYFLVQGLH